MKLPSSNVGLVEWRMANGSLCHLCPLNHMRPVGCDGPLDAEVVLIGEAPGAGETAYNMGREKYGRPFVGKSGWSLKVRLLAPAGLTEIETDSQGHERVKALRAFIMNVVMCQPPKNKIGSPAGRKARLCCSRSASMLIRHLLQEKPDRVLVPLGATALELLTGRDTIDQHRGRPMQYESYMPAMPTEAETLKAVLRGVKPWTLPGVKDAKAAEETWGQFEKELKRVLQLNRRSWRASQKPTKPKKLSYRAWLALCPEEVAVAMRVLDALHRCVRRNVAQSS